MGSNAVDAAIIIIQGDAILARKDPTGVKLPAQQVAEMTDNGIGKEFAKDRHCRLRYRKFASLIYAVRFIHVIDK